MKQTIDNLDKWYPHIWSDFEWALMKAIYRQGEEEKIPMPKLTEKSIDYRDAAFMAALTSKAGLLYKAKLIALQMEQ